MTTRDPRSRVPLRPDTGREGSREPTQSLQIDISSAPPDDRDSHPSLAMGTSDVSREDRTKIESPSGRNKTPQPKSPTKPPPTPARSADDPENRLGQVLGAYKLHELLGKGGMGYVYRAEHAKLGREVALKLLRGDYAKRRDAVLRFFQEAKTVNRVRHRNIVDVTDFVELEDGTTFIIMEFLRGQSLGKWARTGIDLPRALAVLVQICDGLGAAHAVGVVHRDLKPDNVIVVPTSDGAEMVKLLDFGVAKLLNRDDEDIGFQTAAGSVIGTPAYMSPEQAGGMIVDHRSDIYSLGAIMYELFCGQPMFRGRSFGEYVRKHLTENPVPPRQTANGAGIDPALEALILRCLAKDANERFSHILELRDGLLHLLGGHETQPPSYAALAHSSIRPPMSQLSQLLPPHVLPLPAPGMVTTIPTPPSASQLSQISGMPSIYSQYSLPETAPPPEPATPWWGVVRRRRVRGWPRDRRRAVVRGRFRARAEADTDGAADGKPDRSDGGIAQARRAALRFVAERWRVRRWSLRRAVPHAVSIQRRSHRWRSDRSSLVRGARRRLSRRPRRRRLHEVRARFLDPAGQERANAAGHCDAAGCRHDERRDAPRKGEREEVEC
jgi:serine/threonine protein kinase